MIFAIAASVRTFLVPSQLSAKKLLFFLLAMDDTSSLLAIFTRFQLKHSKRQYYSLFFKIRGNLIKRTFAASTVTTSMNEGYYGRAGLHEVSIQLEQNICIHLIEGILLICSTYMFGNYQVSN